MALKTRRSFFGVDTRINTRELARSSRLVSTIIGMPVPPNKAMSALTPSPTSPAFIRTAS
jgi:2-isopropylmalate synthase (EC 2.3.3.13)